MSVRDDFFSLAEGLFSRLRADEVLTCYFAAESTDFVRFNHAALRQAGHVVQGELALDLIRGKCHAPMRVTLSGQPEADLARASASLDSLRSTLDFVPEDPHHLIATEVCSTDDSGVDRLPPRAEMVDSILSEASGLDLVGLLAAGSIFRGFANSFGQRNWYSSHPFNLDWSLYHHGDKAVKCGYAGQDWDASELAAKMAQGRRELEVLGRPVLRVEPGRYRAYLAPSAVAELLGLLGWGGFGLKAHRTRRSSLLRAVAGEARLAPCVNLSENTAGGVAPPFGPAGFLRPPTVPLFEAGEYRQALVSPRSAQEFGVPTNGASDGEGPDSLDLSAGESSREDMLGLLDTGLCVSNLHYLNYSDRPSCRITGMTRFATFWVEGGEIVAPLEVMRFDDTLYNLLGDGLEQLTKERELILDSGTYERRSTSSSRVPGALIDGFNFTL